MTPPLHSLVVFFSLVSFVAIASSAAHNTCSVPPNITRSIPCPPFTSTPSFPFSSSQGCGHPSFHVHCSSPHSIITINNLSFSLLSYEPNSTSLHLSPHPPPPHLTTTHNNCSSTHFPSIPKHPLNFSGSPFRVSQSLCSRFSILQLCPPPNLPNCSHCPWECKLIKNPAHLLQGCESFATHQPIPDQGCQTDILEYLDSYLNKMGIEVEWDQDQDTYFSDCKSCQSHNGICGFNSSDPNKPFLCFRSLTRVSPHWITPNKITILSAFLVFATLLLLTVATLLFRTRRMAKSESEEDSTTRFLHHHRSPNLLPPVFTYEELQISTNNFDPKRKIGDGGFGSVYLGQLIDGRIVAVKHLYRHQTGKSKSSFCNEILILSSMNHPNLVKLHGYCSDPKGLLLVYDYVPNGTLADHLHRRKSSLTWQVRLDVAIQVALAMEYLHFSVKPAIVHRDITSCNIFVERDMRIKVGDFGLSRILSFNESSSCEDFVCTGPQGTPGYLDPDYHKCFRLTEKSDVYSFGVVLLELVSGMRAVDQRRDKREMALADYVVSRIQMGLLNQVVDSRLLEGGVPMEGVDAVAELAFRCVAEDKDDRPDSKEVVAELKRIRGRIHVAR